MSNLCPRGHDKSEVGLGSNGRCRQCRREDHRAYKRTVRVLARERDLWANDPDRRWKHKIAKYALRTRQRIAWKRLEIASLQAELAELLEEINA